MDSLDDARDDLDTQLSYVAGELADRRGAAERLRRLRDQLLGLGGEVGAEGLRLALEAAAEAVGHRSYRVRQLEAALAASEEGAARREAQLQAGVQTGRAREGMAWAPVTACVWFWKKAACVGLRLKCLCVLLATGCATGAVARVAGVSVRTPGLSGGAL